MARKASRDATLSQYVAEILKNAEYEKGEKLDVIVAEAPDLPGCITQAATFEEARENVVDAIEVWVMSCLRTGEDPPEVNGHRLAITSSPRTPHRNEESVLLAAIQRGEADANAGESFPMRR